MNFFHLLTLGLLPSFALAMPYHVKTSSDLPAVSLEAAAGNPLKGFLTSPLWVDPSDQLADIPSSLDFYYIPLSTTMADYNTFDWSYLESLLSGSAGRNRHAVLRFILDYPGQQNHVPQFLIDDGLRFDRYRSHGGGSSPDYSDPNLHLALEQFIKAFGDIYDGDTRIGFVQVGLLGYWGEWHTYPETHFLDNDNPIRDSVALWYRNAFSVTPLQVRTPKDAKKSSVNIGLHDDSFGHSTLGSVSWYFWSKVKAEQYTDFWRTEVMGGEVFPGRSSTIFSAGYVDSEQEVGLCISTTHATYMLLNRAFDPRYGYTGDDITRGINASNMLGYAFVVSRVEVSEGSSGVDVGVEITQIGVAPFYYPLALELSCDAGKTVLASNGVETIIAKDDTGTFYFANLPATSECLDLVTISLKSNHAYAGNPVKLAQGTGVVELSIPLPLS